MQSYKLRKTSETALFPIEHELRMLRQENDKSWTILMLKILSVVFSGIGTTVLFQENGIPALVKYILCNKLEKCISMGWIIIIQSLFAIAVFAIMSFISVKVINWWNSSKDNKKNNLERENLAEIFHKIILNNIITGKSFTKKAQAKFTEMQVKENGDKIKEIKREFCLYLSEAIYYFMIADRQIREEKIIEIGVRENYQEFLNEVGILALVESFSMYEASVNELKELLEELNTEDVSIWKEKESNETIVTKSIKMMDEIKNNILDWKTNLGNTVKAL